MQDERRNAGKGIRKKRGDERETKEEGWESERRELMKGDKGRRIKWGKRNGGMCE